MSVLPRLSGVPRLPIPAVPRERIRESFTGWQPLRYAAGVAALAGAVALLAGAILRLTVVLPEGGGGVLAALAEQRRTYLAAQLLQGLPGLFFALVVAGVAALHLPIAPGAAVAAGILAGVPAVLLADDRAAPALLALSDRYTTAPPEGRGGYALAAEAVLAGQAGPTAAGLLAPLGLAALGLLILSGPLPAAAGWTGLAAGAAGVLAELVRPAPVPQLLAAGLTGAWLVLVGVGLFRPARVPPP